MKVSFKERLELLLEAFRQICESYLDSFDRLLQTY
jgi:hypothetical protein